jgi:hypothetical protein
LLSVWIVWGQDLSPKLWRLSLNQVSGLHSEEIVLVGDLDEFIVAGSPCSLVGSESQVWVPLLTVLTNDLAVIEGVLNQELLRILASRVNIDLGKSVVESCVLDPLIESRLEPGSEHTKLATLLEAVNKVLNTAVSDREQQLLDVGLVTVKVQESSKHLGRCLRVHLEQEDLNALLLSCLIQELGEIVNVPMHVTEIDEWSGVGDLALLEEVSHLDRVVALGLANHTLNLLEVAEANAALNILEVDVLVFGVRQNIHQVVDESIVCSKVLQNRNDGIGVDLLGILDGDLSDQLSILSVGLHQLVEAVEDLILFNPAKEVEHGLLRNDVGVEHHALGILHTRVVLEGASIQGNLFAHLGDLILVVVCENVQLEDSLSDVGGTCQIDFK